VEQVEDHRSPYFGPALRIYNRVFPKDERTGRRYFIEVLREKRLGLLYPFNFFFLVARQDERVVGMTTGSYLAVVNIGFVGYLAVLPSLKGRRVGSKLRDRLVQEMRRSARASGRDDLSAALGEVDTRNPWLHNLVRNKRVFVLDVDYRQPPLRPGGHEVPLALYLESISRPVSRLAADEVRALVYAIYRRLYRVRFPLRLPTFRKMLQSMEGKR
jgi:GNAT superfamily N-acetyltransferase